MKINDRLSVLLMLEKSRPEPDGTFPIAVRLSIEGSRVEFFLGASVDPQHWDKKETRVNVKTHPDVKKARAINNTIIQCLAKLSTDYDALSQKHPLCSAANLKQVYTGKTVEEVVETQSQPPAEKERTISQVLNYKYSKFAALAKSKKRSKNTLKRWRATKRKLRCFLHYQFKTWDVPVSSLKFGHAEDFLHYLLTQENLEENTANKYVKNVRELLQIAERKEWVARNKWDGFKIKYIQPRRDCLSMQDIIKLYQKPLIERLDHARNIFLFSCFTGYAFQEVLDLTKDDVFTGMDGKRLIKIGVMLDDFTYHSYKMYDMVSSEGIAEADIALLQKKDDEARQQAAMAFEQSCRSAGLNYSMHHDRNIAFRELLHESMYGDLLVIDRKENFTHYDERLPTRFIRDLLAEAQCPVVVSPSVFLPLKKLYC